MSKVLYTARATVTGGRANGHGRTDDGALDVQMRSPREMGGEGGGTNPEQLFAVGYAACFEGALGVVARRERVDLGDVSILSQVSLIVCGQTLDLFLGQVSGVLVILVATRPNAIGHDQEPFAAEPSASIDHSIANLAAGVIEDYVVNFSELLVVLAIQHAAADVVGLIGKTKVAQGPQVRHVIAPSAK